MQETKGSAVCFARDVFRVVAYLYPLKRMMLCTDCQCITRTGRFCLARAQISCCSSDHVAKPGCGVPKSCKARVAFSNRAGQGCLHTMQGEDIPMLSPRSMFPNYARHGKFHAALASIFASRARQGDLRLSKARVSFDPTMQGCSLLLQGRGRYESCRARTFPGSAWHRPFVTTQASIYEQSCPSCVTPKIRQVRKCHEQSQLLLLWLLQVAEGGAGRVKIRRQGT